MMLNEKDFEVALAEYKSLRDELIDRRGHYNTLMLFTITSVTAILGFAFGYHPYISLLAFVVIIPMNLRITSYRRAMAAISGYLANQITEKIPVGWDKDYADKRIRESEQLINRISSLRYYECTFLGLATTIVLIVTIYCGDNEYNATLFPAIILSVVSVVLTAFVFIITRVANKKALEETKVGETSN